MAEAWSADQPDYALSESSPYLTCLHPSLAAAKDVSCARASPTEVFDVLCGPPPLLCRMHVSHACCSRSLSAHFEVRELLLQLTPQRTAHFPTTKATPPSAFLTRISKVSHCGQTSLPLTEPLSPRFADQSLSVYAMMWSDRALHLKCVQVISRPIRNRPTLLGVTMSASFGLDASGTVWHPASSGLTVHLARPTHNHWGVCRFVSFQTSSSMISFTCRGSAGNGEMCLTDAGECRCSTVCCVAGLFDVVALVLMKITFDFCWSPPFSLLPSPFSHLFFL